MAHRRQIDLRVDLTKTTHAIYFREVPADSPEQSWIPIKESWAPTEGSETESLRRRWKALAEVLISRRLVRRIFFYDHDRTKSFFLVSPLC